MLKFMQGGTQDQEEDTYYQLPSTSTLKDKQHTTSSSDIKVTVPSPDQQPSTSSSEGTAASGLTIIQRPSTSESVETSVSPPVDPALWPSHILDSDRVEIVRRGPFKVASDFNFPKETDGRAFHSSLLYRTLSNGEKITRSWLVYSEQKNAVFCFACKLFSSEAIKLTSEGHSDWSNINNSLRTHEKSSEHTKCMLSWRELDTRLKKSLTIDHQELTLLEAEKKRW